MIARLQVYVLKSVKYWMVNKIQRKGIIQQKEGVFMDIYKAIKHKNELEKLYENWTKQGLSDKEKRIRLNAYLDEMKRKYNKDY